MAMKPAAIVYLWKWSPRSVIGQPSAALRHIKCRLNVQMSAIETRQVSIVNTYQFVRLFCCFTSQVNSYGHGGTVSSPNHTFSWASFNKQLTSTSCTCFRLWLTTTLLEWFSGREENDRRKYFMIIYTKVRDQAGIALATTKHLLGI